MPQATSQEFPQVTGTFFIGKTGQGKRVTLARIVSTSDQQTIPNFLLAIFVSADTGKPAAGQRFPPMCLNQFPDNVRSDFAEHLGNVLIERCEAFPINRSKGVISIENQLVKRLDPALDQQLSFHLHLTVLL